MYQGTYRIADHVIEIISLYEEVQSICADYVCAEPPEFSVMTSADDIAAEHQMSLREDMREGREAAVYPESYLETLAVYRKICSVLADSGVFLFHGSVIAVDGQAYLFTAKSGTGKSTHTRLWREYFGERAVMVNDDKPLLKIAVGEVMAYGTPWNGKHRLGCNTSAPLKAVCILERGTENSIVPVAFREVYPMLLQQIYRPREPEKLMRVLGLLDSLGENIPIYHLRCNMDIKAAETAYNGMKG